MFAQAVGGGGGGTGSTINQLIKSPLLKLRAHHPDCKMLLTHFAAWCGAITCMQIDNDP